MRLFHPAFSAAHHRPFQWLLWLCLCWPCFALAEEFNVRFERINTKDGVTLGYIDAILQDSEGFIWMGGENGLARYDGYQFRIYRNHPDDPHSLSNNTVWSITEDGAGDLWIATEGGVSRYNRKQDNFTRFLHDPNDTSTLSHNTVRAVKITRNGSLLVGTFGGGAGLLDTESGRFVPLRLSEEDARVWAVFEDLAGRLWLGTEGGGAISYDPQSGTLARYHQNASEGLRIGSDTVRAVTQDRGGDIWLGTDAGVYRLNNGTVTEHWPHIPGQNSSLGSDIVWDVYEDRYGDIWVATDGGGLNLIRRNSPLVRRFTHSSLDPTSIGSNVLREVIEDQIGDIWTANFPSGANVFHRAAQWVAHVRHDPEKQNGLNHPSVLALWETSDGSLWIGTDGGGINQILPDGTYRYFRKEESGEGLSANAVLSLTQDREGFIWIGTWGGGVNRYSPTTGELRRYPVRPDEPGAMSHPNVWALLTDKDGDVWLGTEGGGLLRYDRESDSFTRIPYDKNDSRHTIGGIIWSLFEDHSGMIWVGTNSGLSRLDKTTGAFRHWQHIDQDPLSLSNNTVLTIFEDREHQIWAGTRAGLNRLHPNGETFRVIRTDDGLASDNITSILQDGSGRLWLGTTDGLASLDPKTYAVRNYNLTDWAGGKFNYGAALKRQNGELLFGGIQGFIRFLPENLQVNTFKPPVVLTDFQVFNQSITPNQKGSPLTQALTSTRHIVLNHRQSVFSFEFAALNYYSSESNRYAYKLEGFDRSWNDIGTERKATYTNLGAGEYFFRVKAANNDGIWNEDGLEVRVTIAPAPWRTWWAYLLYTVAAALLVWSYIRAQQRKIARERAVNERLRQLDKMKDDFLANTSHELRTPLNGIIGLADTLLDGIAGDLNAQMRLNLQMISSSGKRLASLVNDILDFARLKNRKLQVHLEPVELRSLVDSVLVLSRPLVGKKDLDLSNHVDVSLPAVLADENRLQQILYNLVGNAIKFTDQGSVVVSARQEDDWIWISVSDTGIGIAEEHFNKIFASFEQLEDHDERQYGGAGLGLAVTRQLVELQGGEIRVFSELGRGSTFYFSLRSTNEVPAQEAQNNAPQAGRLLVPQPVQIGFAGENSSAPTVSPEQFQDNQRFRLLLVDDEPVNRQVLRNHLALQGYQMVEAENGNEALEALRTNGPFDLVLLDIMMPRMSGYEVCSHIRNTHPISELPVIFLTAKSLIADLMDGFEVGANDFLTKPIAKSELLSRVRTHLQLLDVHRHLEEKVKERTVEVEQANKVLETLDGIVATINQEVIFARLLDVLLREASHLFPAGEKAIYWSLNPATQEFEIIAGHGFHTTQLQAMKIKEGALLTRYCEQGKRLAPDIYQLKPTSQSAGSTAFSMLPGARAELALAIRFDGNIVGFLCLLNLSAQDAFLDIDISTLSRFHAHMRSALLKARLMETLKAQNERLEDASLTDQLTGLRNRRYLLQYLDSDVALTLRSHRGRPADEPPPPNSDLLFFVLHIDRFKEIDETYGQGTGDKILVQIKRILGQVFRGSDFLARWGGEQFLMVARFSNRKAAPLMAERVRQAVSSHTFDLGDDQVLHCTCSIGFASFPYLIADPLAFSWHQVVEIAEMCVHAAERSQNDGWVGLEARAEMESQLTYQAISTRPQQLINERKLLLHTSSIDSDKPLYW